MKRLLPFLLLYVFCGCASTLQGSCVPRALYQASARVLQQHQQVRFAVSHIRKGVDHIQVQFKKDGAWKFSCQSEDLIFEGEKEFSATPYKYLTWQELMAELDGKFD